MRRKQGQLVPLEEEILSVIKSLNGESYGYLILKNLSKKCDTSTLYRALKRLVKMGKLESHLEDLKPWPLLDENLKEECRPIRRLYKLIEKE